MKIDIIKLIEDVGEYTKQNVKPSRYEHSVRVAEMSARMCRQFGIDDNIGYLAGIGHDMCKDLPEEKMIEIASRDGDEIIPYESKHTHILHGRAAAVMMKEHFNIQNPDILEAVANHTSGKIGMCDLSKILYLADKIEPGRPQSTEEYRENLLSMNLDTMFFTVYKESYDYIVSKGFEIYPGTEKMLEYYKELSK